MTYTLTLALMKHRQAVARLRPVYPWLLISHVKVLQAVRLACAGVGGCGFHAIDAACDELAIERARSLLAAELATLVGAGQVDRVRKGARFQYSVSVQGMCLLNDFERALRSIKLRVR